MGPNAAVLGGAYEEGAQLASVGVAAANATNAAAASTTTAHPAESSLTRVPLGWPCPARGLAG